MRVSFCVEESMSIETLLTKIVEQNTMLIEKLETKNQIILELLEQNNELLMQISDEETPKQTKNLDD